METAIILSISMETLMLIYMQLHTAVIRIVVWIFQELTFLKVKNLFQYYHFYCFQLILI